MELQVQLAPAYDFVISLAAAAQPGVFEMPLPWARAVRAALPSGPRRDLSYFFGDHTSLGTNAIQAIPELESPEPALLVRALARMEPVEFAATLLVRRSAGKSLNASLRRVIRGRSVTEEDRQAVSLLAGSLKSAARRRFQEVLRDPAGTQGRYVALLTAHCDGWFARTYGGVAPVLAQRAKQGRRSIGKLPPKEVIARLTGGFTVQSADARSVTLVPSQYVYPFIFFVQDGKNVIVAYGARVKDEPDRVVLSSESVRVLKALADETRLHILELLVQRPLYGQQIATMLRVSHPTVSHHMAQLRIAGLARTEVAEDGNKRYVVRPDTVQMLCSDLQNAFVAADTD